MTDGSDSIHGNLPITYEYMEKIYGFCYKRIRNSCDAEDLAQEIMLEVIRAWKSGVRPGNYHAWVWSLARNRWCKYLERRKRSVYNIPYMEGGQLIGTCQSIGDDPMDEELVDSEEKHEVSRLLSRLSQVYREMVVLYYLKMKTIPEIACLLSIPEGTVKRRLHNARQQVKEGLKNMQENGRRSYAPVDLNLWGGYSIPKYWPHLDRALTKNILAAAYDEPITVEQLSEELGVASVYIEEELRKLVEWRFVKKHGVNQFLTDFIILGYRAKLDYDIKVDDAWEGVGKQLVDAVTGVKDEILTLDFYGREFDWGYLMWNFIIFACTSFSKHALARYQEKWSDKSLPKYTKEYRIAGMVQSVEDESTPVQGEIHRLGWSNLHVDLANVCGYKSVQYANLYQRVPFPNRDDLINASNVGVLVKLAADGNGELTEPEKEAAAFFVSKGVLKNVNGALKPQLPIMKKDIVNRVQVIIDSAVKPCVDYGSVEKVAQLADTILLPQVRKDLLEEYVNWIMLGNLSPLNYVLYQCREEGLLPQPEDFSRAANALYLRLDG